MKRWDIIALVALLGCFCSLSALTAQAGASTSRQAAAQKSVVPAPRAQRHAHARCFTACKGGGPNKACRLVCGDVIFGLTPDPDNSP